MIVVGNPLYLMRNKVEALGGVTSIMVDIVNTMHFFQQVECLLRVSLISVFWLGFNSPKVYFAVIMNPILDPNYGVIFIKPEPSLNLLSAL